MSDSLESFQAHFECLECKTAKLVRILEAHDDLVSQLRIARSALANRRPVTSEELRDIDAALAKAGS